MIEEGLAAFHSDKTRNVYLANFPKPILRQNLLYFSILIENRFFSHKIYPVYSVLSLTPCRICPFPSPPVAFSFCLIRKSQTSKRSKLNKQKKIGQDKTKTITSRLDQTTLQKKKSQKSRHKNQRHTLSQTHESHKITKLRAVCICSGHSADQCGSCAYWLCFIEFIWALLSLVRES